MLLNKEESCLLLIDLQEKLTAKVLDHEAIINRCTWLLSLCHELGIEHIIFEQYPSGLGSTIQPLRKMVTDDAIVSKLDFSCWRASSGREKLLQSSKKQLILIGIETHVCILQTALDLLTKGYSVFVVVDAVSSRNLLDHKYGLKRMKQAGAILVTSEMVFFEWFKKAGSEQFKTLGKRYFQ